MNSNMDTRTDNDIPIPQPEKSVEDYTPERMPKRKHFMNYVKQRNISLRTAMFADLYESAIQEVLNATNSQDRRPPQERLAANAR